MPTSPIPLTRSPSLPPSKGGKVGCTDTPTQSLTACLVAGVLHAQIFDPESNSWARGATMTTPRNGFGMVALHNGSVLAAGGYSGSSDLNSAEIYMPGVTSAF